MVLSAEKVTSTERARISAAEIVQQYNEASRQFSALGAEPYIQAVVSGTTQPGPGAHLFLGTVLAGPGSNPTNRIAGVRFLARAFAEASHVTLVAERVRAGFVVIGTDSYENDEAELAFYEHLKAAGAPQETMERFAALLHGSERNKIFAIGFNKTGTTSLEAALHEQGVLMAPQISAERLFRDWAARRFDRIIAFSRRYEGFQDVPYSLPFTYQALDQAFPDARFVLTVRGSADEWYESLLRFSKKMFFQGDAPNWEQLDRQNYNYPGFVKEIALLFWRWNDFDLYDRQRAIDLYETHNTQVREYFSTRPDRLLEVNVAEPKSYRELCDFIDREPLRESFQIANASK